jgi:transcriptional regulator with XRE-family HTH domain
MMNLHEIADALKDRRLSVLAEATGVNRNTLAMIRDGKHENPRYDTTKAISDYFEAQK